MDRVSQETEQSIGETLKKAISLYIAARDNTRSGDRKLGFFDGKTGAVTGEVTGFQVTYST